MSARGAKIYYGIDNNVAPREDLSKYGEAAVKAGKLSQRTLNKLKRQEAAHANAVEGYPLFVAASMCLGPCLWAVIDMLIGTVLLSVVAGVPNEQINTIGVWYTLSRVAFSLFYSYIESPSLSSLRSVAWWSGNISCITALVQAGKKL